MSPELGDLLVCDVLPRLRAAASSVPAVGHEDREELVADMTATAAAMMDSAERAGKSFTAGNIAWFASRAARSGRRSTGSSRSCPLSPGAGLDGTVHLDHLDGDPRSGNPAASADPDEPGMTDTGLYDVVWVAGTVPSDPSEDAARNLDWHDFVATLPRNQRVAVLVLARGGTMREAGRLCGLCDSAACLLRKRVAAALLEFFGSDLIGRMMAGLRPAWEPDLRASREHVACRSTTTTAAFTGRRAVAVVP